MQQHEIHVEEVVTLWKDMCQRWYKSRAFRCKE